MGIKESKILVEGLREQWRILWRTRIDDKVRAEGIARHEYPKLFVERGTVIIATRDYKPLSFHEILEQHLPSNMADAVNPSPSIGGCGKFVREVINRQRRETRRKRLPSPKPKRSEDPQRKKGGRGWLHYS